MTDFVINTNTNRLISTKTALYRKLKKLGQVKDIEKTKELQVKVEQPVLEPEKMKKVIKKAPEPTVVEDEPEFDESKLQLKLADISTDMIQKNLKKIVKSQKLSDIEMDDMLKRLLYKRLCLEPEPKPKESKKKEKPAKKKTKFKVVVPSSSESDSD
jgi:hypothetical protein